MGSLYRSQHELLPLFKKGTAPHINNVELGKRGRWRSNLWTYPGASSLGSDARRGLKDHPTVKPTAARDQLRDTDADGLPEIAHTIERFHGNCDFGHAAGVVAGFQDISDHALVTTDCRFDLRAHVIAGGLLPIHAPMLFDRKDMPVALGRRCCGSWSRHGPLAWRNDETGARVSGENGVENSAPIIGAIGHK